MLAIIVDKYIGFTLVEATYVFTPIVLEVEYSLEDT